MSKKPLITLMLIAILSFSLNIVAFADDTIPMETLTSAENNEATISEELPLPIDPIIIFSHFPIEH